MVAAKLMHQGDEQAPVAAALAVVADALLERKGDERGLMKLHAGLVTLQHWVVHQGLKAGIVFEGRAGAGQVLLPQRQIGRCKPVDHPIHPFRYVSEHV